MSRSVVAAALTAAAVTGCGDDDISRSNFERALVQLVDAIDTGGTVPDAVIEDVCAGYAAYEVDPIPEVLRVIDERC